MAFCNNCGTQIQEGKKFCASCGQPVTVGAATEQQQSGQQQRNQQQTQYQQTFQQGVNQLNNLVQNTADETAGIDPADITKNKAMGGFAYFLFFLPLLVCPESKYGRFHSNQGLIYLFLCIGGGIANGILSAILTWRLWWLSSILSLVIGIPILVIGIIGLINGFSGKAKELPVIGKFRIIK